MAGTRHFIATLGQHIGEELQVKGWIHNRRDLGKIRFVILRDRTGTVQCVLDASLAEVDIPLAESCIAITGKVVENAKAPEGVEIQVTAFETISAAAEPTPIEIPKVAWNVNPDTLLNYRYVSLREMKARAVMKIQAELVRAFRSFLTEQGFTEIYSPKIVSAGAEGGADLFEVDYYGKRAYLAQSPQLYKQIMVGVYERVFETAPVYRAEQSHTSRHLSEYYSLDVEMGFIDNEHDVMDMEEAVLKAMMQHVAKHCQTELTLLEATLPNTEVTFPRIPLMEARDIVKKEYDYQTGGKDLDPEAERLISRWAKETHDSDFIFVTDYPQNARPFYTYPSENGLTRGLDLIFRGVEITSGGQRVHDYQQLLDIMQERNMKAEQFAGYLEVFKHGMPPHGGFAIGAERLTALLLGIENVRFARAFPRDEGRLQP